MTVLQNLKKKKKSYGLNVCVPQFPQVEILTSDMIVLGCGLLGSSQVVKIMRVEPL
jgi:hypothetical protein